MSEVKDVRTNWSYDGASFAYEIVPGTLVANDDRKTLRFELREVDGDDPNLEVLIQRQESRYIFKTDYYGEPLEELPLRVFDADGESVLFYDGKYGVAYFHLTLAN